MKIPVRRLDPELSLPTRAHEGDAGIDLQARERMAIAPGERALVPTGIAVAIPDGHVGLVAPRSGLAVRHGLSLVNAPGVIDSGYRGEIKVIAINLGAELVELERGERIAQLLVVPCAVIELVETDMLPPSRRGEGGFGSTGR